MRIGVGAAIDRRIEGLIVAWVRSQWPVLRLVPARWIRPFITPTAVRARRLASRGVLALSASAGIVLAGLSLVR
jgi:hypothetical protein